MLVRTNYTPVQAADYSTSVTTGAFTPPANSLVLAIIQMVGDGSSPRGPAAATLSNTGTALTWTRPVITNGDADPYGVTLLAFVAEIAASESITLTFSGLSRGAGEMQIHPFAFTGYDTVTPIGVTGSSLVGPTDGQWTPALSGSTQSTSELIAALGGVNATGSGNLVPVVGSGYNLIVNRTLPKYSTLFLESLTGSSVSAADFADVLGPSSGDTYGFALAFMGLEIRAAGGVPPPRRVMTIT